MLVKDLISQDKYSLKCPYPMTPKGICIHNTANDTSAKNEISYMKNNDNDTSFHIAIDDKESIQAIPFDRNAWASGDGSNGLGNRSYIHIEICYSLSGGERFNQAEKRTAIEVAKLLKDFNWTIANVKKHQDFSNKYCPHRTLDMGWQRFLNMVQAELNKLNKPLEVKKKMKNIVLYANSVDERGAKRLAEHLKCGTLDANFKADVSDFERVYGVGGEPLGGWGKNVIVLQGADRDKTYIEVLKFMNKI